MTRRRKILIVAVFALIVLLYVGAAANGGGRGQGDAGADPGGVVGWLGDLVGKPPAAKRSDLSAPCLSGDTLTIDASCTLHVARSDTGTRRVTLHATDSITVTARPPRSDDAVTNKVDPGKDVDVTVDSDGGDIVLSCTGSDTCTVTLP